jgi:metal-responsive CopG/Arc/MetJ family transcriptional regulator
LEEDVKDWRSTLPLLLLFGDRRRVQELHEKFAAVSETAHNSLIVALPPPHLG